MFRKKLFGNNIPPDCEYCRFCSKNDGGSLVCRRGGAAGTVCRNYLYDPLRREPKVAPEMRKFSADDFKL